MDGEMPCQHLNPERPNYVLALPPRQSRTPWLRATSAIDPQQTSLSAPKRMIKTLPYAQS